MIFYTWVGLKFEPERNLQSACSGAFIKLSNNNNKKKWLKKACLHAQLGQAVNMWNMCFIFL